MSRPGGPYDNHADQPPAGWPHSEQLLWLHPDDWVLDDYYEYQDQTVSNGAGATRMLGGTRAPVDTWRPGGSPPSPPDQGNPPVAQLTYVREPGGNSAGLS